MTLSFVQLLARLRTVDRRLLVMVLVAMAALLYTGNLGLRYLSDTERAQELEREIRQLAAVVENLGERNAPALSGLANQQALLEEEALRFSHASDDDLILLLSEAALESRVHPASVNARAAGTRREGMLEYGVRRINLRVEGRPRNVLDFIDAVSLVVPGARIESVSMGGFPEAPWASLEFEFLLDPVRMDVAETTGS